MARDGFSASIDLENSSALLALDSLRRKQLPFAQALALTRTAQAADKAITAEIPSRFEVRSNFLERGVRIKRATKRVQSAEVFWRAPGGASRRGFADALAKHETGGTKSPRKNYIAIPRGVKRGKGGRITKANRPNALLKKKRVFIAKTRTSNTLGIYQRLGSGRKPIKMLYFLTPRSLRIGERFEFVDTARTTAKRVYKKEFGKSFAKALASRR